MNEFFAKALLWAKSNKDTIIKTSAAIVGAIAGALVAGFISDAQIEEGEIPDWVLGEDEELEDEE